MRRLDESLTRLAERGTRTGADALMEQLERRLELGAEPVIVALEPRRTDMQTQERTPSTVRRRGPWIAAAAFGLLVVIAVAAAAVLQLTEEEALVAGQPPGPLEEFVHALQANDVDATLAVVDAQDESSFIPWLIGLDTSDVAFTDCVLGERERVECTVNFGPSWFYSRITGEDLVTTFSARVGESEVNGPSMPPPAGMVDVDAEFEQWVLETYPERYDEMFSVSSIEGHIRFSGPSGAARTELVEEYLASR